MTSVIPQVPNGFMGSVASFKFSSIQHDKAGDALGRAYLVIDRSVPQRVLGILSQI